MRTDHKFLILLAGLAFQIFLSIHFLFQTIPLVQLAFQHHIDMRFIKTHFQDEPHPVSLKNSFETWLKEFQFLIHKQSQSAAHYELLLKGSYPQLTQCLSALPLHQVLKSNLTHSGSQLNLSLEIKP